MNRAFLAEDFLFYAKTARFVMGTERASTKGKDPMTTHLHARQSRQGSRSRELHLQSHMEVVEPRLNGGVRRNATVNGGTRQSQAGPGKKTPKPHESRKLVINEPRFWKPPATAAARRALYELQQRQAI